MRYLWLIVVVPPLMLAGSPARAIGCFTGGVAGAVAGHMAHHGVIGAIGGCIAGHEYHKHQLRERQTQEEQNRLQHQTQNNSQE